MGLNLARCQLGEEAPYTLQGCLPKYRETDFLPLFPLPDKGFQGLAIPLSAFWVRYKFCGGACLAGPSTEKERE